MTLFSLPPETHQIQLPPSHVTCLVGRLLTIVDNFCSVFVMTFFYYLWLFLRHKLSVDVNLTLNCLSNFPPVCAECF